MFQETDDKVPTGEITEDSTENESPTETDSPTKTDSLDRNRFDRDHEMSRDRMSEFKCPSPNPNPENNTKTF